ncbi:MAG: hypothetical protein WAM70_14910, partial [Pyrinomonadaceae bacterium]
FDVGFRWMFRFIRLQCRPCYVSHHFKKARDGVKVFRDKVTQKILVFSGVSGKLFRLSLREVNGQFLERVGHTLNVRGVHVIAGHGTIPPVITYVTIVLSG